MKRHQHKSQVLKNADMFQCHPVREYKIYSTSNPMIIWEITTSAGFSHKIKVLCHIAYATDGKENICKFCQTWKEMQLSHDVTCSMMQLEMFQFLAFEHWCIWREDSPSSQAALSLTVNKLLVHTQHLRCVRSISDTNQWETPNHCRWL